MIFIKNAFALKFCCIAAVVLLVGCANQATTVDKGTTQSLSSPVSPLAEVEQQLLGYFSDWEGTPYRFGGSGRRGIDCSAFVQNTYKNVFDVDVPRTTLGQATLGYPVDKSELIPGDLVLFKTSRTARHVGIVVNGNKFMHVSEKRGVKISALDNVYWRKKYWKAVRPDNGITI